MPTVKTAISLPEPLFQRAKVLAQDLRISRSQLVAMALTEFVKQHERKALIEAINQAFEDGPTPVEEKELLQGIRTLQRRREEEKS